MSGFTALNVEPEDTFEEEIDDTKEIQLEEAFKLYQNALKLHSQGPQYFQDALDAYKDLLQSEVFKYPEAVSEYAHDELEDEPAPGTAQVDAGALSLLPSNAAESSASSVPQLLYLAYKNRGQFVLDVARHQLPNKRGSRAELCEYYSKSSNDSVRDFAKALERDDSDLDLWKKAARIADVLSTQRIARFCWESVLAGDDDDAEQTIDLSGLDEAFAAGELEDVIRALQDDLTRLRSSDVRPKTQLLAALRETNDPYHFLPKRAKVLEYLDDRYRPLSFGVSHVTLQPAEADIPSLGHAILQTIQDIHEGSSTTTSATTVKIELPDLIMKGHTEAVPVATDPETTNDVFASDQDQNLKDTVQPLIDNSVAVESPPEDDISIEKNSVEVGEPREQESGKLDGSMDGDTIEVRTAPSTRKRSATAAGNEEPEGRTKSKRLRARESLADVAALECDPAREDPQYFLDQLAIYEQADQAAFDVVNSLLAKFDMRIYFSTEEAKQVYWHGSEDQAAETTTEHSTKDVLLLQDLKNALLNWSEDNSQALSAGHGNQDLVEKSTGMSLFLQHSRAVNTKGVEPPTNSNETSFVSMTTLLNSKPTNAYDAAYHWFCSVLTASSDSKVQFTSSYTRETWTTEMKETTAQLATTAETYLYETLSQRFLALVNSKLEPVNQGPSEPQSLFELVQSLFEIYLDAYSAIANPSSKADPDTRTVQRSRLNRWADLADDFMHLYLNRSTQPDMTDPLILRFIWASTTSATFAEEVDKAHVVLCLEDLKTILEKAGVDPIYLPNNAAMPVISVAAIHQEISRLNTLDFFTSVFDSDNSDPVAVIESLEPILEATFQVSEDGLPPSSTVSEHTTQVGQLVDFLNSGNAALKLLLWRRLQNAYTAISYTPKIVSCLLRAVEVSFNELYTSGHFESDEGHRQVEMLRWLKDIDELMVKLLVKILGEPRGFDCVDDEHLKSSLKTVTALIRLLHGFIIYEDSVRVGQTSPPQLGGATWAKHYEKSKDRFKEMIVRAWTLQYLLLKEATIQDPASYTRAADDLAEYLSTVHNTLGLRCYCKHANKSFIKLVKSEFGNLHTEQDYSADMAQVFFDLYQLRFASGIGDVSHGCPTETLDKKTAWSLIPIIMKYAQRFNMKDLIKSELKGTIDKIQQALGAIKNSPALGYNKRLISGYLKSTINANDMYRCIRGIGDLPTRLVQSDTQSAASSGWYFLLGYLILAKYKSAKRVNPTPTDELDSAATFFRQDLDHSIEKWETWFRLAQVYDAKIEDDLIWNSTKLNESRGDIALLERQAIHCYIMSTAMAMRLADDNLETAEKMEEMLTEFASRLYASSRPPLDMEAFKTDKHMRHMSSLLDQTMSKQPFYEPLEPYSLWRFAAHLLGKKLTPKPKPWMTHYTRAKCLWKMFQSRENQGRVSAEDVVDTIIEAIDALPKKEKSNEPILEPHLKLVSTIHKLVKGRAITHDQGQEFMQATRYAQGVHLSADEEGVEWEEYMLRILKKLAIADKSNWHHRIIDRRAHVIYDETSDLASALGAKHEFTQQIFTKTMTLQVWKPENERPGRHYVYTGRYVSFFVHLLEQLNDRANLDQLVRRIRRKTTDFLDHTKIWEEVATTFVRLLRRMGKIPEGRERALFDGMNHEEFTKKSEGMETWAHDPDTSSMFLDIMRDAIDLKRLNNSLMKGPVIDDLIGDSYACLYDEYIEQLPPEEQPPPSAALIPQGTFINMTTDLAPGDEDAERARLNNLLRAQGDGAADGPLAVSISAPVGLGVQTTPNTFPGPVVQSEVHRAPNKPGRTKTVTRREIQRKAEAAIVKPPPIKTPILSKRLTVDIPSRAGQEDSAVDKRLADAKDEDMGGSGASSRRGSIQDSVDGEADGEDNSSSELSDLDDMDDDKKQLFSELEMAGALVEDGGDDAGDDVEEDDAELVSEDGEAGEGGSIVGDQGDQEVADAEDGIEVQGSQEDADDGDGDGGDADDKDTLPVKENKSTESRVPSTPWSVLR